VAALVSNPIGWATLGAIAVGGAVVGGLLLAASGDVDDQLGSLNKLVPASGPAVEEGSWSFRQDGWWSGWDYTVKYRIRRELSKDAKDSKDGKDGKDAPDALTAKRAKERKDTKDRLENVGPDKARKEQDIAPGRPDAVSELNATLEQLRTLSEPIEAQQAEARSFVTPSERPAVDGPADETVR
jgi:hypothetical protein